MCCVKCVWLFLLYKFSPAVRFIFILVQPHPRVPSPAPRFYFPCSQSCLWKAERVFTSTCLALVGSYQLGTPYCWCKFAIFCQVVYQLLKDKTHWHYIKHFPKLISYIHVFFYKLEFFHNIMQSTVLQVLQYNITSKWKKTATTEPNILYILHY